ncbi:fasciclin domain-containing protein [Paucibacter sp. Y2R2-4]|uniref:fasciclin domain-containing protein n=1 Tax=Paucibacter sp. Y2R2-4 TaxID=2893553 RepID=UPI0021E360D5|nr:fasciclin domain-containing protein [Paucibacter sp. Y2R2-4]MCV2350984.1 fasciclin domain-containing protein [Paucibacter sp. Y2R2-4]
MMMSNLMNELSASSLPALSAFPGLRGSTTLLSRFAASACVASRARPVSQGKPSTPSQPSAALPAPQGRWEQALMLSGLTRLGRLGQSCQAARPGAGGSPSPFHLLVPSDTAFESLLRDWQLSWVDLCADLPRLRHLLLGHVVMDAQDTPILAGSSEARLLRCANGSVLKLQAGGIVCDAQDGQARLRQPFPARFGVLPQAMSIDRVLRPAEQGLMELLASKPELSHFHVALQTSGLSHWLQGSGPFTLLAPSNSAWAQLAQQLDLSSTSLLAQPPSLLQNIVGRYVFAGRWMSDELPWGHGLVASNGERLPLSALGLIGQGPDAQALASGSDQQARNGVLHRLDQPLLLSAR